MVIDELRYTQRIYERNEANKKVKILLKVNQTENKTKTKKNLCASSLV